MEKATQKSVYEVLTTIQGELKAPKSQYNSFGRYKYRNCEDILEALKPLLVEHNATLFISDEISQIEDRFYVSAVVTFSYKGEEITVTAHAREEDNKKGMDGSQVTGASSSYARKYALNGLFLIDDTKDSDATNSGEKEVTRIDEDLKNHLDKISKMPSAKEVTDYCSSLPDAIKMNATFRKDVAKIIKSKS